MIDVIPANFLQENQQTFFRKFQIGYRWGSQGMRLILYIVQYKGCAHNTTAMFQA
jgi:hypothetical protein